MQISLKLNLERKFLSQQLKRQEEKIIHLNTTWQFRLYWSYYRYTNNCRKKIFYKRGNMICVFTKVQGGGYVYFIYGMRNAIDTATKDLY